ncbi:MAG: hypothetical protein MUE46_19865 [Xanthomonadales bacterium]|jgi:hypothetical protein|nr:hypothetical protein [Xanthomonadales bacterium]
MAKRKPIVIDGITTVVADSTPLAQVVPAAAQSITTSDGRLIPRDRFASTPLPENFRVNLSAIEKGALEIRRAPDVRSRLLADEERRVQRWLDGFEASMHGARRAVRHQSGAQLMVYRCPLPDQFALDEINVMLDVGNYPSVPPIGLYVSNNNLAAATQLDSHFRRFRDTAFHDAPSLTGFTWICFAYRQNRWHFDARDPERSDNISKFLDSFYCAAQEVL